MNKIILLSIVLAIATTSFAQSSYTIPSYSFDTQADYKKHEKDILACIEYMATTPIQSEPEKGQQAAQFLMDWAEGSQDVSVTLNEHIVSFIQTAPFMLVYYVAGFCRHHIKQEGKASENDCIAAGLALVADVYINHELPKDEALDKLAKLKDDNKLKKYATDIMANLPKE